MQNMLCCVTSRSLVDPGPLVEVDSRPKCHVVSVTVDGDPMEFLAWDTAGQEEYDR